MRSIFLLLFIILHVSLYAPNASALCNDCGGPGGGMGSCVPNPCCSSGYIVDCGSGGEDEVATLPPSASPTSPPGGDPNVTPAPPPEPPSPSVGLSGFNMNECSGGSDCENCSDPISCGTESPFAPIQVASTADGTGIIDSSGNAIERAKSLKGGSTKDTDPFGAVPASDSAGGSLESKLAFFGVNDSKGKSGDKEDGEASKFLNDGSGNDAIYKSAGGGSQSGGQGAYDENQLGDGGKPVSSVEFGAKQGSGADGKSGAATAGEFDPDNSDTWSEEEKEQRRKSALEMDPDTYFKLISKDESIFKKVHKRYRKIHGRWNLKELGKKLLKP